MRGHLNGLRGILVAVTCCASAALVGCSSSRQTSATAEHPPEYRNPAGRQVALQHFIDGSVYDMKGEHAKAALEYQDALRYEQNPGIYYALSKDYAALGKHELAVETGRRAVVLEPDNLEYRRNLAEAFVGSFDLDSAATQYEVVVGKDSNDVAAWYSLARIYQARDPAKALTVYEGMTRQFGPDWNVLLQIADLCNKMEKYREAADALRQMTGIDPDNIELKQTLARTYVRAAEYDRAVAIYKDLRDRDPENLEYGADIGGVYLQQRQYDLAKQEFDPILAIDTVNINLKLHIGELYFGQVGKDSTLAPVAQSVFERIRKADPQDWRPYWFLGAIGSLTHDDSTAVRNFRKVTELASWNADAWVYLSSVFLEKNNFEEVAKILESAVKILPDDFRVNFLLGVAYSRLSRNTDAARVLEKARVIDPKNLDAISQLALVYDAMKKYEESDSLYEEALRLDPNNHLVLNNYGYSLADRGIQLQRALEMASKAVEAQPENPSYLDTIGWVYYRLGRFHKAEEYVKKSIAKGDPNAVVFEHLGDIYFKLDDKQRAMEQWENALKLDENNTALRDKISRGSL